MDIEGLVKKLKAMRVITSLVGEFKFLKQLGEGGNSNVCLYTKDGIEFAVKFFSKGTGEKTKNDRFIDEYFGMAQIPSHPNIAQYFHLDTVEIDGEKFLIIIMKRYQTTLKGTLKDETDKAVYLEKLSGLFRDLLRAVDFLHANGVIHRDIKPQNILYDDKENRYVLADFGISKFAPEKFAKEAETRDGERLANYRYCAPEQRGNKVPASYASDLYSVAQVLQEYATGDINHGGGRAEVKYQEEEFLSLLDKVIARCLMNDPDSRFSNTSELREFMHKEGFEYKQEMKYLEKEKQADLIWDNMWRFDNAIARGFLSATRIGEITDPSEIADFLESINITLRSESGKNSLWMTQSDGSDLNYLGSEHINKNNFVINYGGFPHQATIRKILVHHFDGSPYKNFFIIMTDSAPPFNYADTNHTATSKKRTYYPALVDVAELWNGLYFDPNDVQNRYIKIDGTVIDRHESRFESVYRFVASEAIMVSPCGIFSYEARHHDNVQIFLKRCLQAGGMSQNALREYWRAVGGKYCNGITNRL